MIENNFIIPQRPITPPSDRKPENQDQNQTTRVRNENKIPYLDTFDDEPKLNEIPYLNKDLPKKNDQSINNGKSSRSSQPFSSKDVNSIVPEDNDSTLLKHDNPLASKNNNSIVPKEAHSRVPKNDTTHASKENTSAVPKSTHSGASKDRTSNLDKEIFAGGPTGTSSRMVKEITPRVPMETTPSAPIETTPSAPIGSAPSLPKDFASHSNKDSASRSTKDTISRAPKDTTPFVLQDNSLHAHKNTASLESNAQNPLISKHDTQFYARDNAPFESKSDTSFALKGDNPFATSHDNPFVARDDDLQAFQEPITHGSSKAHGHATRQYKTTNRQRNDTTRRIEREIVSILHWENPIRSGLIFSILVFSIFISRWYSLLHITSSLLCIATGINLFYVNFILQSRKIVINQEVSHPYKDVIHNENRALVNRDSVSRYANLLTDLAETVVRAITRIVFVDNTATSIKWMLIFFAIWKISAVMSTMNIVLLGIISAFIFPRLYISNKDIVDANIHKGQAIIQLGVNKAQNTASGLVNQSYTKSRFKVAKVGTTGTDAKNTIQKTSAVLKDD